MTTGTEQPVMHAASLPPVSIHRPIVVVGASGGVGTSAVAAMLGAVDAGVWRSDVVGPLPTPDVVVTGVSMEATRRAQRLVGQVLPRLCEKPVLVVVSDGRGRPPLDARAQLTMLRPLVRERFDIPYIPAWRCCTSPDGLSVPTGTALAAVNRLRAYFAPDPVRHHPRRSR